MSIRNFKVLKEAEIEGESKRLGEEVFMSDRDGAKLVAEGVLADGRVLDPADKDDAKRIKEAEKIHDDKYKVNMAKQEARDEEKQEDHAEDDVKRANFLEEAEELMTAIADADGRLPDADEVKQLQRLETPVIEKRVEELRKEKAALDEGESADESDEEETPIVAVNDRMGHEELEEIASREGLSDTEIEKASNKGDLVKAIEKNRKK